MHVDEIDHRKLLKKITSERNPPSVEIGLVKPRAAPDLHRVVVLVLPVDGRLSPLLDADVVSTPVGWDQLVSIWVQEENLFDGNRINHGEWFPHLLAWRLTSTSKYQHENLKNPLGQILRVEI